MRSAHVEKFHRNVVIGVIVGDNWVRNCIIFVSFSRRLDGHLAFLSFVNCLPLNSMKSIW